MSNNEWKHQTIRMVNRGLDLVHHIDDVDEEHYVYLTNVTSEQESSIIGRPGLTKYNSTTLGADYAIIGMARMGYTKTVVSEQLDFIIDPESGLPVYSVNAQIHQGTSGDSLSQVYTSTELYTPHMLPFEPPNSHNPWLYLFSSLPGDKIKLDNNGNVYRIGILPPLSWSQGAGDVAELAVPPPTLTTLSRSDLHGTYTDWRSSALGVTHQFYVTNATVNPGVRKPTQSAVPTSLGAYVGTLEASGAQLASIARIYAVDLKTGKNSNSRVEAFVRVSDPDNVEEIRLEFSLEPAQDIISATAGNPISIEVTGHGYETGDRIVLNGATDSGSTDSQYVNGVWTITKVDDDNFTLDNSDRSSFSDLNVSSAQVLSFSGNSYVKAVSPDEFTSAIGGETTFEKALQEYIENFNLDQKLQDAPPSARPGIRSTFERGKQSIREQFKPSRLDLGRGQWTVFSFAKNQFLRTGSTADLDWADVNGFQWTVKYSSTATTDDNFSFTQLDIVPAASGLDSSLGVPYDWRVTFTNPELGIESNPSALMPEGIEVVASSATLTLPTTSDSQVTHLRIYRRGGTLREYHLVGEVPAGTPTFLDDTDDLALAGAPTLRFDNDPPITRTYRYTNHALYSENLNESPWSATNMNVSPNDSEAPDGSQSATRLEATAIDATVEQNITRPDPTKVWEYSLYIKRVKGSGTVSIGIDNGVSDDWADVTLQDYGDSTDPQGVWHRVIHPSIIGGISDVTIKVRVSTSGDEVLVWGIMATDEETDSGSVVHPPYVLKTTDQTRSAYLSAYDQTALAVFGPFLGKYLFAIRGGDLYWCKPENADAWPAQNRLQVTSAAEPLVHGTVYNGRVYVFSKDRMYSINLNPIEGSTFVSLPTPCNVGLANARGLAVGPYIYFLGIDGGIYKTNGGPPVSITRNSLVRPIFEGVSANGYPAVDYDGEYNQLVYADPYLYFLHKNDGRDDYSCMRYHVELERWEFYYPMPNNDNNEIVFAHREEVSGDVYFGDDQGFLYTLDGIDDDGTAYSSTVKTGAFDQGIPEVEKLYGDVIVEATVPAGVDVLVSISENDQLMAGTNLGQITGDDGERQRYFFPINAGEGLEARSMAVSLSWTTTIGRPEIHSIGLSYRPKDRKRTKLSTDWDNLGIPYDKYIWGCILDCETQAAKTLAIQGDGTTQTTESVSHVAGRRSVELSWTPFRATQLRILPTDTNEWEVHDVEWLQVPDAPHVTKWATQWEAPMPGKDVYVYGVEIEGDTLNNTKIIRIEKDGDDSSALTTESLTLDGHDKVVLTWSAVKASTLRILATDANSGYLYRWKWLTTGEGEAPELLNFDSNWESPGGGRDWYVYGIELDIEQLGSPTTPAALTVLKDGGTSVYSSNLSTAGTRNKQRIMWSPTTAKELKFSLDEDEGTKPFRIYDWSWLAQPEPPSVPIWDSNYENDGNLDDKWISGLYLEIDTEGSSKDFQIYIDGSLYTTKSVSASGRKPVKVSFGPTRGVTMRFLSTTVAARIYTWRWIYSSEPVQLTNMGTQWDSLNWPYEKLIKGFSIEADTLNAVKTLQLRTDGDDSSQPTDIDGNTVDPISIQFNGPGADEFVFPAMVRAHTVRLDPTDSNLGRLYKLNWIFDREPAGLTRWETQEHTFNVKDYSLLLHAEITLRSTAAVTLTIEHEGTTESYTIDSTGGNRRKRNVNFSAVKGKSFKFTLTSSAPFYVYNEDTYFVVRPFKGGDEKSYQLPFAGGTQNP